MLFEFETVGLLSVLFVALRLGVLFYFSPIDAFGRIPRRFVVMFSLVLAGVLVFVLDIRMPAENLTISGLALTGMYELANGLAMVMGVYVAFTAFMVAGQLIDAQTGFAAAAILNPTTNVQEPVFGVVLQLLAIALFFLMGMHRLMLEGIARSFSLAPLGAVVSTADMPAMLSRFGLMFIYGLVIAAPVLVALLMLDAGVAMMSRTMPQMNIYFVTLPLRIAVGLAVMAFTVRYLLPLFETLFREIFRYWGNLLV